VGHPLPTTAAWDRLEGRHVLVRVDFNVPLVTAQGVVTVADDFRMRLAIPLLKDLLRRGAQVTACTHLGRPKGHVEAKWSVEPLRGRLEELCPGVELMENLRFDPGEEANDAHFGQLLVKGVDYFVNEAFGVSHRTHASVVAPPLYVPSAAGPALQREVDSLEGLLESPARPFVAILGGAKVADKLGVLDRLVEIADTVIVGGAMAFTFWKALGIDVGDSLVDEAKVESCRRLLATDRILLPNDVWTLPTDEPYGAGVTGPPPELSDHGVPDGRTGLDIGPRSTHLFAREIERAATVLWNGPVGVVEDTRFEGGTRAVAESLARCEGRTIVGGGDSVAAVDRFGLAGQFTFVSSGGGASLELLEFGDLPGLRALRECPWNSGE
jgi:phosphoglycerate kinase